MAQANLGGLAAVAIGGAAGYGVGHVLMSAGHTELDSIAWGAFAGCMTASLFGLLYDRSIVPEFRRSYRVLTKHLVVAEREGPDYDPRERMAFFGIPVAFATFIVPVVAGLMWIITSMNARKGIGGRLDAHGLAMYFVAGVMGVITTFSFGRATTDLRLLTHEPNAAPAVPDTHVEEKKGMAPRLQAVFIAIGGAVLLGINHYSALNQHIYYPKAIFGGAIFIMAGVAALFEPRIMTRHLPIGKTYPKHVLIMTLLAIVVGAAAGWEIMSLYH